MSFASLYRPALRLRDRGRWKISARATLCLFFAALAFGGPQSYAAAPTLDALFPAGASAGSSTSVTVVGKADPWPVSVWCSNPDLSITVDPKEKLKLQIEIPAKVTPGPVLVRTYNDEGASEPVTFIVSPGHVPSLLETEPNSSITEPKPLEKEGAAPPTLPLVIDGRLSESRDVDLFPLTLKKGQILTAAADSYSLRAPVDPHLILYGPAPDRASLALGNDSPGSLDPILRFEVPADGDYLLGIMGFAHPPGSSIGFTSKASAVYRLTVSAGPWLGYSIPSVLTKSGKNTVQLIDSATPDKTKIPSLDIPAASLALDTYSLSHPTFANALPVPVIDTALQSGEKLTLPAAVSGIVQGDSNEGRHLFSAKKSEKIFFRVESHYLHSDLDPVLIIEDSNGKELKRADDTKPTVDAELLWTASADGDYVLRVKDVTGSSGANHRYLLTAETPVADFSATAAVSKIALKPGDKAEIKISLKREHSHKEKLEFRFEGLPKGVTADAGVIPDKTGEITITLKATADAPPTNQPFRIYLTEKAGTEASQKPRQRRVDFSFVGANWRGPYLVETTPDLWLTVLKKPQADADKPKEK